MTWATKLALAGAGAGILGSAVFWIDLATRPPCQDGYVRLVDLEPVAPVLSLLLGGLCLLAFWRARRGSHPKLVLGVSIALLVFGTLMATSAVATLVHHHGERYDYDCWTF